MKATLKRHGLTITLAMVCALPSLSLAMPGDLLDQALHQSMREHAQAQSAIELTGTTRHEADEAVPSVENSGLNLEVGRGVVQADPAPAGTRASLGNQEPDRHAASTGSDSGDSTESMDSGLSAN